MDSFHEMVSYEVGVRIDESGKVVIAGSTAQTTDASDEELCPCPKCDQGTIRVGETTYACDNAECKFRGLGRNVCKRDISVEEAKILTEGKSDLIEDFISRRGKPFPAYLILESNKVGFEFPHLGLHLLMQRNFLLSKDYLPFVQKLMLELLKLQPIAS